MEVSLDKRERPRERAARDVAKGRSTTDTALRTLSHDVRNALNGAKLHLTYTREELLSYNVGPHVVEAMDVIDRSIDRAAQALDEYQNGPSSWQRRIPVRVLCARLLTAIIREPLAGNVSLRLEEPLASDVQLELDATRIEGVLMDLLHATVESALYENGHVILSARKSPRHVIIEARHEGGHQEDSTPGERHPSGELDPSTMSTALSVIAEQGGSLSIQQGAARTIFRLELPVREERREVG